MSCLRGLICYTLIVSSFVFMSCKDKDAVSTVDSEPENDKTIENKAVQQKVSELIQPEDITVLMADRSILSGGPKYNELDPGKPFKRFWVDNWKSPDASIEWKIIAPKAGEYKVAILIESEPGVDVEIKL